MKRARLELSDELLRQVLCIPSNVVISGVCKDDAYGTYHLFLEGDGLPDACQAVENSYPRQLIPVFFKDDESEIVSGVTWRALT